jgi:hypothetical protein
MLAYCAVFLLAHYVVHVLAYHVDLKLAFSADDRRVSTVLLCQTAEAPRKSQRVTDYPVGDCSPAHCPDAPPDPLSRTVSSVQRALVLNSVTWARRKPRHRRRD